MADRLMPSRRRILIFVFGNEVSRFSVFFTGLKNKAVKLTFTPSISYTQHLPCVYLSQLIALKRFVTFIVFALLVPCLSFAQMWKPGNGFREFPFYKKSGSITLHLTNYMFSGRKVATPPVNFVAEVTAARNFSLGPMFTYFQFKRSEFEAINATRWVNPEIRYHEMMIGLRAEYHITSLVAKIINKKIPEHVIDIYTSGWMGYSFVKTGYAKADQELVSDNTTLRGGCGLGARSLVLKFMGLSLEGGYSSYGYASFGLFFLVR